MLPKQRQEMAKSPLQQGIDPNIDNTKSGKDTTLSMGSSCKKRKVEHVLSTKKKDYDRDVAKNNNTETGEQDENTCNKNQTQKNWEQLFNELQAERVTKAEALLYAYTRESEERERLMRSYNQELEHENQKLKSQASEDGQQKQAIQDLQSRVEEFEKTVSNQTATIRAYQQLTGTTLSNVEGIQNELHCDCTVANPETKTSTKFRISTVSSSNTDETSEDAAPSSLLRYQPLENPDPLPEFLHEEIEFESSQLPPLLQNLLSGIFPDE